MAGSGQSRRRFHTPALSVQLGILLPALLERSLEVRHSAWDRDHAGAGAQQRDRAAEGGARRAEREEREPIPPLFAALPAPRALVLLTPHFVRGYAISALRASSDHFVPNQVCGSVSGAPAREAGEAGANPARAPLFRSVAEQQLQRAVTALPSGATKVRVLPLRPFCIQPVDSDGLPW